MKIFSEKYNFKISMTSKRCQRIPDDKDRCPGVLGECSKNIKPSCGGETIVTCLFPLHAD